ncbi:LysR substrate-binding domain-containing protein [Paracidovorax cattleyae]|uniref:LysR substrate-binding domain-containing protein n=1 Tax=Paracidovorax cattleyae TaxID=80868 RepID=UPI003EBC6CF6
MWHRIPARSTGSPHPAASGRSQTASGVSRALARLEKKLDTTLLRRTTRRIELTEEGHAFLTRARAILTALDEAEEHMAARRHQPAGRLRVNAATPFMLHVVAPLVPAFRSTCPQIALELDTDERNIDLLERRTDVAIRIGTLRDSTLHARPLGSSRRGPHGDAWTVTPDIAASSGETLRQLALAGAGIVCLSDFMTAHDRERGDLLQLLTRDTADVRQPISAVYYRNTQPASRIACFLDFLAARLVEPGH